MNFCHRYQWLGAIDVRTFLLQDDTEIALDHFGYLPLSFRFHVGDL
jgi:hypothetical protein